MKLPIEVGDKVRIMEVSPGGWHRHEWGMPGEVGVVIRKDSCTVQIAGVGEPDDGDHEGWWHAQEDLALFADELEDMPEDTVVTFSGTLGALYCVGGIVFDAPTPVYVASVVRRNKRGAP